MTAPIDLNKLATPDKLMFSLADMLQCSLYDMNGEVRGTCREHLKMPGGLTATANLTVCSDEVSHHLITVFVHVRGDLWMYVMVTEDSRVAMVFNGKPLELRPGGEHKVGRGFAADTLKTIRPTIADCFTFDDATKEWSRADVDTLLADLD